MISLKHLVPCVHFPENQISQRIARLFTINPDSLLKFMIIVVIKKKEVISALQQYLHLPYKQKYTYDL